MRGGVGADVAATQIVGYPRRHERRARRVPRELPREPPGRDRRTPDLSRMTYAGLTRGTVWLNGHNLGRYPEKILVSSLYLPECWLADGVNTLTVFDETGAAPTQVQLVTETAASREVIRVDKPADPAKPMTISPRNNSGDVARQNQGNLAFGRPATASSARANQPAGDATDGDAETNWCAADGSKGQWLQVDLGAPTNVASCEVVWPSKALSYQFVLEGSTDGQSWSPLGDDTTAVLQSPDSPSPLTRWDLGSHTVRYVRVTVTGTKGGAWASICELRLFNEK